MSKNSLINAWFKLFQWKSKWFSGLCYSNVLRTNTYQLQSKQNFYISTRHFELITKYLKWKLKKSGRLIFPYPNDFPLTKKPTEVWMGKGKGNISDWSIPVKKGMYFFLLKAIWTDFIQKVLTSLQQKLPIRTKLTFSNHQISELNNWILFFQSEQFKNFKNVTFWFKIN